MSKREVHIWRKNLPGALRSTEMRCGVQFHEHNGPHIAMDPAEATCLRCLRNLRSHLSWRVALDAKNLEATVDRTDAVERMKRKKKRKKVSR